MSNELIVQKSNLPATRESLFSVGTALSGLALAAKFAGHPRINIKGSRFRLLDAAGDEVVLPETHLDVIIVSANPHKSKTFYLQKYNPADTEFKAPDCSSDNGVAPNSNSTAPQCASCATCPHNAWGSKVTDNGKKTRACADSQRVAVLLLNDWEGAVYELKVPAASLTNLGVYAEKVSKHNKALPEIVTRLSFDTESDYPKLTFTPVSMASEAQIGRVLQLMNGDEVKACLGLLAAPQAALPAPVAAPAAAAAPVVPPPPVDPFAVLGAAPSTIPAEVPVKCTRKKAEAPTEVLQTPVATPLSGITPGAQAAPINTPPTNAALDDLLSAAFAL